MTFLSALAFIEPKTPLVRSVLATPFRLVSSALDKAIPPVRSVLDKTWRATRAAFAGVAVALLGACASDEITCEIDQAFTSDEQQVIAAAADAWNQVANVKIVFTDDGEWLILSAESPPGIQGMKESERKIVRIDPHITLTRTYVIALHELGHVLGLKHTTRGVMHPTGQSATFSDEDIRECERVGACTEP